MPTDSTGSDLDHEGLANEMPRIVAVDVRALNGLYCRHDLVRRSATSVMSLQHNLFLLFVSNQSRGPPPPRDIENLCPTRERHLEIPCAARRPLKRTARVCGHDIEFIFVV
ncbi:hypothetical protein EVAR_35979_1 [Eumeta japonica]|uniref:Uncharacterized protein n=1 Tax=Eumeta variegata TaxID=151549 RepID=A0A4C1WUW9_EUMVA|nr:hypothetical protein EVAR_35979_1 [Eumeta japonica]